MNKLLLSLIFFLVVFNFYSQNTDKNIRGFKNGQTIHRSYDEVVPQNNSKGIVTKKPGAGTLQKITAVTATRFTGSMNAFGVLISESKPLQYVPGINAISFIHRKSPTYTPSSNGNSSSIVGMYSTNTGSTWDSTCLWANAINFARNPQGGIYNPTANTNINNAYMVGCGPMLGSGWDGNWYASKKITTPGNTMAGTDQQALLNASLPNWMKHHFSQYSFTAIEGLQIRSIGNILSDPNAITNPTRGLRGAAMVKGQFNAGAFVWSIDSFVPCIMNRADGSKYLNETMVQAWNENGTVGYVVMLGVRCGVGPCLKSYQPIVYKTTNSGSSWVLLPANDFTNASYTTLLDRLYPINTNSTAIIPYFSSAEGIDATVDINDNLHIVCTVVGAYSSHNDSLDYIHSFGPQKYSYSYGGGFEYPTIYDFYTTFSGGWQYHIVDSMGTEAPVGPFGSLANLWTDGTAGKLDYNARIQMSRTADGKEIFYSWTESDPTTVSSKWNLYPDIKMKGYAVTLYKLTQRSNITGGVFTPFIADQQAYFHYMSPRAISTGTTSFEIPFTISFNGTFDGSIPIDHIYLKGVTMAATDFTLNPWLFGGGSFLTCGPLEVPEEKPYINSFDIIPNPTSSIASVSLFSDKIQLVGISIFDHLGRFIENREVKCEIGTNNIPIDLSSYASGLYLIKVATSSFTETKKLIKE